MTFHVLRVARCAVGVCMIMDIGGSPMPAWRSLDGRGNVNSGNLLRVVALILVAALLMWHGQGQLFARPLSSAHFDTCVAKHS